MRYRFINLLSRGINSSFAALDHTSLENSTGLCLTYFYENLLGTVPLTINKNMIAYKC